KSKQLLRSSLRYWSWSTILGIETRVGILNVRYPLGDRELAVSAGVLYRTLVIFLAQQIENCKGTVGGRQGKRIMSTSSNSALLVEEFSIVQAYREVI
ncbi:hypothetical protein, partial [Leptolyngbya sp. FACHB-36]|uniref:hypothetical protein n=1 Tax=Leptolyngbya sp. FACHB-36 TaxID=2692808 RepID=UPI001A7E40EA